ncbi:hypothetical protein CC78DRAFT_303926 [Lojkania enalia]|uniref:Myb transcription factor n=1 Tax=Lojkania enalia TaxID=147567 RepID=A0A9P4N9K7_9PLEO|nr:hypothetical protein CC78DRAFT_303926 [Didymosphaeria enalia]
MESFEQISKTTTSHRMEPSDPIVQKQEVRNVIEPADCRKPYTPNFQYHHSALKLETSSPLVDENVDTKIRHLNNDCYVQECRLPYLDVGYGDMATMFDAVFGCPEVSDGQVYGTCSKILPHFDVGYGDMATLFDAVFHGSVKALNDHDRESVKTPEHQRAGRGYDEGPCAKLTRQNQLHSTHTGTSPPAFAPPTFSMLSMHHDTSSIATTLDMGSNSSQIENPEMQSDAAMAYMVGPSSKARRVHANDLEYDDATAQLLSENALGSSADNGRGALENSTHDSIATEGEGKGKGKEKGKGKGKGKGKEQSEGERKRKAKAKAPRRSRVGAGKLDEDAAVGDPSAPSGPSSNGIAVSQASKGSRKGSRRSLRQSDDSLLLDELPNRWPLSPVATQRPPTSDPFLSDVEVPDSQPTTFAAVDAPISSAHTSQAAVPGHTPMIKRRRRRGRKDITVDLSDALSGEDIVQHMYGANGGARKVPLSSQEVSVGATKTTTPPPTSSLNQKRKKRQPNELLPVTAPVETMDADATMYDVHEDGVENSSVPLLSIRAIEEEGVTEPAKTKKKKRKSRKDDTSLLPKPPEEPAAEATNGVLGDEHTVLEGSPSLRLLNDLGNFSQPDPFTESAADEEPVLASTLLAKLKAAKKPELNVENTNPALSNEQHEATQAENNVVIEDVEPPAYSTKEKGKGKGKVKKIAKTSFPELEAGPAVDETRQPGDAQVVEDIAEPVNKDPEPPIANRERRKKRKDVPAESEATQEAEPEPPSRRSKRKSRKSGPVKDDSLEQHEENSEPDAPEKPRKRRKKYQVGLDELSVDPVVETEDNVEHKRAVPIKWSGSRVRTDADPCDAEKMLNKHHRLGNPPDLRKSGPFTKDEEEIVRATIQAHKSSNGLNINELVDLIQYTRPATTDNLVADAPYIAASRAFWKELYEHLPDRSTTNIQRFVRRRYHNFKKGGGMWDEEEDNMLKELFREHPNKWKTISQIMGTRAENDIRDRWKNYLQYGNERNTSRWSEDEEQALRRAVTDAIEMTKKKRLEACEPVENIDLMQYVHWTAVSKQMGGMRTRLQCSVKWKQMQKRDSGARFSDRSSGKKKKKKKKIQDEEMGTPTVPKSKKKEKEKRKGGGDRVETPRWRTEHFIVRAVFESDVSAEHEIDWEHIAEQVRRDGVESEGALVSPQQCAGVWRDLIDKVGPRRTWMDKCVAVALFFQQQEGEIGVDDVGSEKGEVEEIESDRRRSLGKKVKSRELVTASDDEL